MTGRGVVRSPEPERTRGFGPARSPRDAQGSERSWARDAIDLQAAICLISPDRLFGERAVPAIDRSGGIARSRQVAL